MFTLQSRLAVVALATTALSSFAPAEVYLVGFKTVYVIPARDPYEEERYAMEQAYANSYDAIVDREEADLRMVDDLATRHPRDADLLDRMRDRIRDDIDAEVDAAARQRDERLAGWYTSAPNVYEACPEMVMVYRRERPVNVIEVKFSKGHTKDTYVLREPYRNHPVEPLEGMTYGKRLDRERFRQVALVPSEQPGHGSHVHSGWGGAPERDGVGPSTHGGPDHVGHHPGHGGDPGHGGGVSGGGVSHLGGHHGGNPTPHTEGDAGPRHGGKKDKDAAADKDTGKSKVESTDKGKNDKKKGKD